jgi:5-methylcytosine-specific restriction endonuclease McrA
MPSLPGTFRAPHAPSREESSRAYDQQRGSARERGYSRKWDKASISFLRKHRICEACEKAGVLQATEVTDHIVPHKGDMALFWDRSNWQACCRWHHDVVKQILEREFVVGAVGRSDLVLTSRIALDIAARHRL